MNRKAWNAVRTIWRACKTGREIDVSEKVFANGPNMLVLCLTVIGLIKIYTRFEKMTTLADNFLAFIALGYLVGDRHLLHGLADAGEKIAAEAFAICGHDVFDFAWG